MGERRKARRMLAHRARDHRAVHALPVALPGLAADGLTLPADIAYDMWARIGPTLAALGRSVPWALGDWLVHGEHTYGEKYAQAASATGLAPVTLQNYHRVASRFPRPLRKGLDWSFFFLVAGVDPAAERERWLARARREHWTTADLRDALKRAPGKSALPVPACKTHTCRRCGAEWEPK